MTHGWGVTPHHQANGGGGGGGDCHKITQTLIKSILNASINQPIYFYKMEPKLLHETTEIMCKNFTTYIITIISPLLYNSTGSFSQMHYLSSVNQTLNVTQVITDNLTSHCSSVSGDTIECGAGCSSVDSVSAFEAVGSRIDPSQWTQLQFGLFSVPTSGPQLVYQRPWYVLFCLWKSAYKRSLAAYRKE